MRPSRKDSRPCGGSGGRATALERTASHHRGTTGLDSYNRGQASRSSGLAANTTVFDSSFAPATLTGPFRDPLVPAGYGPFNIANIGGLLVVTYAEINPHTGRDVAGVGNGYVAVFDTNGVLVRHL